MRRKLEEFMRGRYGADELSRFMLGLCIVLILVNMFTGRRELYTVSLVVLAICYYRILSRDYAKRSAENRKYLDLSWKVRARLGLNSLRGRLDRTKRNLAQRKNFHIYKCPSCGQKIRIPRGKGKICITCPKCKNEFEKKS